MRWKTLKVVILIFENYCNHRLYSVHFENMNFLSDVQSLYLVEKMLFLEKAGYWQKQLAKNRCPCQSNFPPNCHIMGLPQQNTSLLVPTCVIVRLLFKFSSESVFVEFNQNISTNPRLAGLTVSTEHVWASVGLVDRPIQLFCIWMFIGLSTDKYKRHSRAICYCGTGCAVLW